MAIKTFTSGEVLTASDTNTYLANAGLDYITRGTVTSAAAGLVISGCFTSTYDNYRIVIGQINLNPNPCSLFFRMRDGGSDYNGAFQYWAYNGIQANGTTLNSTAVNDTSLFTGVISTFASELAAVSFDLYAPQTASIRTFATVNTMGYNGNFYTRNGTVVVDNTTQFDGISFFTDGVGTPINKLQVTVYGYRKP
jgi:hypothetical protein